MIDIIVREEGAHDQAAIFNLHEAAFGQKDEAKIVEAVRAAGDVGLSLVALLDEQVVGHVLFSPVTVEGNHNHLEVWGLGPVAVLPNHQSRGIGKSLIETGLERCRMEGVAAVVLLGHTSYYPRFGFEPASKHGLSFRGQEVGDSFMVLELSPGATSALSGAVHYVSAFD